MPRVEPHAIRATYYTSVWGDSDLLDTTKRALREMGFDPQVFKKTRREEKAKGVDIALTKDMLSHAFMGNYETAVLYAGDGDYLPLIEEVKRLGKRVHVHFFLEEVNEKLRLAADGFYDLTDHFVNAWMSHS